GNWLRGFFVHIQSFMIPGTMTALQTRHGYFHLIGAFLGLNTFKQTFTNCSPTAYKKLGNLANSS
ncbi:MAG: hypothetical protein ACFFGZ_07830, partial [Candidatus Thorarchaeota archaeon]